MEVKSVCEYCNCNIEDDLNACEQEQKCFAQLVNECKTSRCDEVVKPEVKLGRPGVLRWLLKRNSLYDSRIDSIVDKCVHSSEEEVIDILKENYVYIELPSIEDMKSGNWSHTAIYRAAELGNPEIIAFVLGFSVNYSKNIPRNFLNELAYEAASNGKLNNIIELVKLGADLETNYCNTSIIEVLSENGYIHIVQWMFNNNFIDKNSLSCSMAIHKAIEAKYFDIVEWLVEIGVDLNEKDTNGKTAIHFAVKFGNISLVQWLVQNGAELFVTNSNNHVLHTALEHDHIDLFKWLLSQGGDMNVINSRNQSLLHVAASKGNVDLVKFLVHNTNCDINAKDDIGYSVLLNASSSQNIDIIRLLCKHGADIHTKGNDNYTVLHFCYRNLEILQEFVNLGVDIHAKDDRHESVLYRAALFGNNNYEIIKWLLDKGLDVTDLICHYNFSRDKNNDMLLLCLQYMTDVNQIFGGQTLLCKCARNLEAVKILIKHKADVNLKSPLMESLKDFERNIEVANYLIDHGADITYQSYNGETVLYKAVTSRNFEFVKKLVELGANVNTVAGYWHETVLMQAVYYDNNLPIVKYLVENGANVNVVDGLTKTALIHAANNNNWNIVKFLVENGANINYKSEKCPPVIHNAVQTVNKDVTSWLLDHGALVNNITEPGQPSLFHVCLCSDVKDETKKLELIKLLITYGANVNSLNAEGETILFAYLQNIAMVDYLIKKGIDVNIINSDGFTVLHLSLQSKHFKTSQNPFQDQIKIIKSLLNAGANVNLSDAQGVSPLHLAVSDLRYMSIAKALVLKGANVNEKDDDGNSILHKTLQGELALWLCDKGADLNARNDHDVSVLQSAIKNVPKQSSSLNIVQLLESRASNTKTVPFQSLECIQYSCYMNYLQFLIHSVSDINARDYLGRSALHYAVSTHRLDILQLLFKSGASILSKDHVGNTVMHTAASQGSLTIVSYLLDHMNHELLLKGNNKNETPLHVAVIANNIDIVKLLLKHGVEVDHKSNENITALHLACKFGNVDIVKYLLHNGANVCETSTNLITAIHLAVKHCKFDVFKYLLEHESTLESRSKLLQLKTKSNQTLLHFAARFGTLNNVPTKIVEYLLESNAIPVDCVDNMGNSALHYACRTYVIDVVKLLVAKGAKINLKNDAGNTPLHLAAQIGNRNIVKYLCKNGGNAKIKNKKGNAPIHIAVAHGRKNVFDILVDNVEDLYIKNRKGNCGIHMHVAYHRKASDSLIENFPSANVNVINNKKQTPLQLFLKLYPNSRVSDLLITKENINNQDVYGNTALHKLLLFGENVRFSREQKLIESGMDLTIQNKDGISPMHVALENLDHYSVEKLIPHLSTVNIVNNMGWNILHQAVTKMKLQTVKMLFELANVGIVNAKTNANETYLHLATQNIKNLDVLKWLVENYKWLLNVKDANGNTVLHTCIGCKHIDVDTIDFLVRNGADVHCTNGKDVHGASAIKHTVLHEATGEQRLDLVNYFISQGVDVNIESFHNYTALHYAVGVENLSIVKTLCENGANVNAVNSSLRTALHSAAISGCLPIVKYLVEDGKCDVQLRDLSGKNAFRLALECNKINVVNWFVQNNHF